MTQLPSSASLRRLYLEWVEEQLEEFKDSVPRSELLDIADEVVANLQVNGKGQYQLTELLLLEEVDRTLFRRLKLPGFRAWVAEYRETARREPGLTVTSVREPPTRMPVTPLPRPEPEPVEVLEAHAASF